MEHRKLTEKTKKTVRGYFEDKDWNVVPIDKILKKSSGDFFVYKDSFCKHIVFKL